MTLKEQLDQINEAGFARMPKQIATILLDGIDEITTSDLKKNATKVGEKINNATLIDINGDRKQISDFMQRDYLVLNFYRGGWCPYCNMELRAYEQLITRFNDLNTSIVAISAEIPDNNTRTFDKNNLSFPVLSDVDAKFMKSLGIVFTLNDDLKREYSNFGIDLKQFHGNLNFELPVPGVYVVNKNFEVVFKHLEENYMTRFEPTQLLNILKEQTKQIVTIKEK
ncbi:peroxiredoxin-like family protein [uncultured Aquimarina sp.]|uniref:peroxiredoxin-like family protein n=1 Tax=uncultured Aquimarina sp. TaxID=575652 RepID=UPI0026282D71|nr:peroxiredoxin-like family protein [uncultured Aquimarina sp.]